MFLAFVLVFLAANLIKIEEGGYLPVGIGLVIFTVLSTWRTGRRLADASRDLVEGRLQEFVNELHDHEIPPCGGCRAAAYSSAAARAARRWRCERTWSTTTRCTGTR